MSEEETSHAEQMVTKLESLMLLSAGMRSVTVDGQTVQVSDLKSDWEYWQDKVAQEDGTNPGYMTVDLSNGGL